MHDFVYQVIATRIPTALPLKYRADGDFFLVLAASNQEILTINQTAMAILQRCDGRNTIGDIFQEMRQIYPKVAEEILMGDIIESIHQFEMLDWVTVHRQFVA